MERLGRALLETVRKDDPEPFLRALEDTEMDPEDAERFLEALRIQREKGRISDETVEAIEDALSEASEPEEREIPEPDPLAEYAGVDRILGTIMTGKEADVLLAERDGEKVALKVYRAHTGYEERHEERVYRMENGEIRRIERGDAALREFSRLRRAYEAGVRVPEPYDARPGLIVMEYIPGEPLYRTPDLDDPRSILEDLLDQIVRLAVDAELVHGDLSAFNVLVGDDGVPYIIDLSEAVKVKEPGAFEKLRRDVKNLVSFFERRYGVSADVDGVVKRVRRGVYGTDSGGG
ncbi:RIO1 family regulatory kinase/ATPase domain-containing protein [Methanopyrus sp.]